MLATVVNSIAIILGSIIGVFVKGGIPKRFNETIMKGISLCVLLIGLQDAVKTQNIILIIFSIVIGAIIGELIDIDKKLKQLGDSIENKLKGRGGKISEGFVTSSLVFCVGAMAIVGSFEAGISGKYETIFSKSIIDGITSIIFSSTLGIGVILSAVTVFIYQGTLTLASVGLKSVLTAAIINEMTAAGGLIIIGLSLNLMGVTKIKVANLLPALCVLPLIYPLINKIMIFIK
ncbi:MAG: DUF554 domain-containing protein [Bacillota bacterium]|nr:DUF554 domain-containing protein [Bacillota bacterium]